MGGHNMYTVMKALKGVEITIPCDDKDTQAEGGKPSKRRVLQAPELMLLLAVAHRQSDGHENLPATEAVCVADSDDMCSLAHVARSSVFNLRKRLCQAGLINYYKSGTFSYVVKSKVQSRRFENVYRLNFPRILAHATAKVHDVDSEVHEMDSKVHEMDSKVHDVDSYIYTNTKQNTTTTTKGGASAPGVGGGSAEQNQLFGKRCVEYIRAVAGLTDSQASQFYFSTLGSFVNGKSPDGVCATIDAFVKANKELQERDLGQWIRFLCGRLKKLPKADTPPKYEDLCKAFSESRKASTHNGQKAPEKTILEQSREKFEQFCKRFGITDEQIKACLPIFDEGIERGGEKWKDVVDKIIPADFEYFYNEKRTVKLSSDQIEKEHNLEANYEALWNALRERIEPTGSK